jgi:hypothetical protein
MEQCGWLMLVNAGTGGRQSGYGEGGKTREYRISPDWLKGANFAPLKNSDIDDEKGAAAIAPLETLKGANDGIKGCKMAHERAQNDVEKGATAIAPEPRATINKATKSNHHSARERAQRPSTRFDEFWSAYPVKAAGPQCLRKWRSSNLDALADTILADIAAKRATDRRWLDGFIPNPHTYLNQERWNDPVQPVARGGPAARSVGKQVEGLQRLARMTHGGGLDSAGNIAGFPEALAPRLGTDASG